ALRLGTYIKFIPYPVTVGFTAGIALIIFASQIKDLFGLSMAGPEPAAIVPKIQSLWAARQSITPAAVGVAAGTILLISTFKRLRPHWPGMLIAIVAASLAAVALHLPVETIASRFGALPRVLPAPALPQMNMDSVVIALPWAVSFALLGAIESLLSAVVADGMSGRRHRSNAELVGQGIANIGSALFGGMCVTGTIARTATNVRAGSHGPVSGMLHALFVLLFMLIAAPLAGYIPLAALSGVLAVVAWNMAEKAELWALIRSTHGDAMVVIVTFLLVVFRDLTEGIIVGFALGGLVFIRAMSDAAGLAQPEGENAEDQPQIQDARMVVYHLQGPFFFGAAAQLGHVLDQIAEHPRALVLEFGQVPFIDSSGARAFDLLAQKCRRKGGQLFLIGTTAAQRSVLHRLGVHEPLVQFRPDTAAVVASLPTLSA
ncbi:MAG: SulP family inorganic anion transporter, partial [Dokdonella sp.]